MGERAVDLLAQEDTYCECLSLAREAERLQAITLRFYNGEDFDGDPGELDPDLVDVADDFVDAPDEDACDELSDVFGVDACATGVQNAALAVVKEAERLQSETERYAAALVRRLTGDTSDSRETGDSSEKSASDDADGTKSAVKGGVVSGARYDVVLEAFELAREAERLQGRVVRLLENVLQTVGGDKFEDDK